MGTVSLASEALSRGARMLRTALRPAIAGWPEDPTVVEVMPNPDGRLWIDRLTEGLSDTGERLAAADSERIVRVVAHHVGAEVHPASLRVSAELPETGERFTTLFGEFTQGFGGTQPSLDDALALLGLGIFGPGIATGSTAGALQLGAGAAVGTAFASGGLGVAGATTLRAGSGALASTAVSSVISGKAFSSGPAGDPTDGSSGPPAWPRKMRRQQAMSQGISAAVHAIRSGDHGGASTWVELKEDR